MASRSFENIMMEHFDIDDRETRVTLLALDEADQNKVLDSLTSKLYQQIQDKAYDIDMSVVEDTKGDITTLQNYEQLLECINIIKDILVQYHQDTKIPEEILTSISNVRERKELFEKGFNLKMDLPITLYNTIVLAIVCSVSLIISTSIEYIKDGSNHAYEVTFDKVTYNRTSEGLLFDNLRKFNRACSTGELDKALDYVYKSGTRQLLGVSSFGIVTAIAATGLAITIIPIMRELVFFFFHTKQSISDYFDIQADLIQMNTEYMRNNDSFGKSDKEKKEVIRKQEKFAKSFRKIANAFAIDAKKSEQKAKKDSKDSKKKYKVSDVSKDEKLDSAPDFNSSSNNGSSLF